jgi:hypothetical protein
MVIVLVSSAIVSLSFVPALMRQRDCFRFQERGVMRAGLFGVRELPFEDLAEVGFRPESSGQLLRVIFRPVPGRGRQKVTVSLKPTDEALETIRAYVPVERITG